MSFCAFAHLFSAVVQYSQSKVTSTAELEERYGVSQERLRWNGCQAADIGNGSGCAIVGIVDIQREGTETEVESD